MKQIKFPKAFKFRHCGRNYTFSYNHISCDRANDKIGDYSYNGKYEIPTFDHPFSYKQLIGLSRFLTDCAKAIKEINELSQL